MIAIILIIKKAKSWRKLFREEKIIFSINSERLLSFRQNKKFLSDNDKNILQSKTSFGATSSERKNEKSENSNNYCKKINLIIFYSF